MTTQTPTPALTLAEQGIRDADRRLRRARQLRVERATVADDWFDYLLDRRLRHMKVRDALGGSHGTG